MKTIPVIFEDHNLARMRPLSWSTPVFEIRCGMFNTRERVGMCTGARSGILLGRPLLAELSTAAGWKWGPAGLADDMKDDCRFLFLNGMLAPDFKLVESLVGMGPDQPDFVWRTDLGLMAALVGFAEARSLAADWADWEQKCAGLGLWKDPARVPGPWDAVAADAAPLDAKLADDLAARQGAGPGWIWDVVPRTRSAITGDLEHVLSGVGFRREPFGIVPLPDNTDPVWSRETKLRNLTETLAVRPELDLTAYSPHGVYCGEEVELAAGTALNTADGPIILDNRVTVMPHCYLEGPLYIGPGSQVKPGARIQGESSFGIGNRLAGEIGESTFGDFANKQHEGFIGHAVLGAWINLGAMTTCSDLKNNYSEIRVDLGSGTEETGMTFVGLMLGDHAKSAIGTLFNTGTCVGFASNIFGAGMPPGFVGNFKWGGQEDCPPYAVDKACQTAEVVLERRQCLFTKAHKHLFEQLGG